MHIISNTMHIFWFVEDYQLHFVLMITNRMSRKYNLVWDMSIIFRVRIQNRNTFKYIWYSVTFYVSVDQKLKFDK